MNARLRKPAVRLMALFIATSHLIGCSTAAKDVATTYVSPTQYHAYDCQQLVAEAQRLQVRYTELGGRLDQAASNDKALTGVGIILFWPALFALGGTKSQEAEYGRLRGEYEAVQQASIQKKCGGTQPAAVQEPPAPAASATT